MDTKINFFKIGLFISTFFILLVLAILWLGKYGIENKKFDEYTIYFSESISGLNVGSTIKYMGYEVGTVKDIKINSKNSEEIKIEVQIQKGTPIKEDNFAILGNLGITGLKYIELKGGSNYSELLAPNEFGVKIIKSKKSALTSFVDSSENITKEIVILLAQAKKILNDENIENLSSIMNSGQKSMENIESFSSYLIQNEKKLDDLISQIAALSKKGGSSFDSIKKTSDNFNTLTNELKQELSKGTFDLKDMTQESFENLNNLLNSLENSLNKTQNLIKNINESPSDILLKQKNIKYGPGEKDEK